MQVSLISSRGHTASQNRLVSFFTELTSPRRPSNMKKTIKTSDEENSLMEKYIRQLLMQ